MTTATGDCHVCGSEEVAIHLLATCDRCRAAAGRFTQQPSQIPGRRPRRGGSHSYDETFCCSFCGRAPDEVRKVFSGPWTFICDGCVALASEAMREALGDDWNPFGSAPIRPSGKTWPGHAAAGSGEERREITAVGPPPAAPVKRTPRPRR